MTRIDKLVELIVDSIADDRLDLMDLRDALCSQLQRRADDARRHPDDYDADELEYWGAVSADATKLQRTTAPNTTAQAAIRDFLEFLGALDHERGKWCVRFGDPQNGVAVCQVRFARVDPEPGARARSSQTKIGNVVRVED